MSILRPLSVALGRLLRAGTTDVLDLSNPVNAQPGTTYTFVLADLCCPTVLTNASAITATVPPHSSVAYPVGCFMVVIAGGAGVVTVAQGAGVTLKSVAQGSGNQTISGQNGKLFLHQTAQDVWLVSGDLTPPSNVIARDATDLTVGNTTSKSTLWSVSVAASKLGTDKTIVFEISGEITIGNATNAITFTIDYGGTTLYADPTAGTTAVVGVPHPFFLRLLLSEHGGVTNSQRLGGTIAMGTAATTTSGHGDVNAPFAAGTGLGTPITGSSSVDSTSAQNLVVSITMSAGGNVANTWTRTNAIAYMLGEGQKGDSTVGPQGIAGTGTGTFPTSANSPQSGNYTLQASDLGQRLAASTSTTQTITVPNASTLATTDGQTWGVHVSGTGVVTIAGGVGVTLHPAGPLTSARQDGVIWITRMDTSNNFLVTGDYA